LESHRLVSQNGIQTLDTITRSAAHLFKARFDPVAMHEVPRLMTAARYGWVHPSIGVRP
jgi:hypothetical protein